MTVGVVDLLEPIYVKHHEPDWQVRAYNPMKFKIESFLQEAAIVQAGERVSERLMAEYLPQSNVGERQSDLLCRGSSISRIGVSKVNRSFLLSPIAEQEP